MSDVYRHGVYVEELDTSVQAMTQVATPAVVFGTAPVHLATNAQETNRPMMCTSLAEFAQYFGWSEDFDKYTLCEAARVFFSLYNVAPVVFVNVLDAAKHGAEGSLELTAVTSPITIEDAVLLPTLKVATGSKPETATIIGVTGTDPITIPSAIDAGEMTVTSGEVTLEAATDYTVSGGKLTLTETGAAKVTGNLTFTSGADTYCELVADEDYTAAYNSKGECVLTLISANKVVDGELFLSFTRLDASAVTASDVVGGVDITTGRNTGIECVEEVYPRFGVVPGTLIAPKFSANAAVAAALHAKARSINGIFKAIAVADIDTTATRTYNDVNTIKASKNYSDPFMIATWPKVALNGEQFNLSTHVAALMGQVDAEHGGIPYKSPSNEIINVDQTLLGDGTDVFLGRAQANYLNGQGVVTALNFAGWKCWGNRTGAYPNNVDVKDSFIPCRRMMNWISNSLVVNYFSQIDEPISKRQIEALISRANDWFNGLVARDALLGGRVEFLESENPQTSLVDGVITLHVYAGLMPPMRELDFRIEVDVNYLSTLFA